MVLLEHPSRLHWRRADVSKAGRFTRSDVVCPSPVALTACDVVTGPSNAEGLISQRRFIVVSGLPASGKRTLAKQIAAAFGLPLYDKDDMLEALFDTMGPIDRALRQRLSRASETGS
jgi:hypothetical protein